MAFLKKTAAGKGLPVQGIGLAGVPRPRLSVDAALRKIDPLTAPRAGMLLFKLIRENLFLPAAVGTFAFEGFQVLELLIAGAVLRCRHKTLPRIAFSGDCRKTDSSKADGKCPSRCP